VIWREPPPKGHYIVRVDTFSLCGVASAPWKLTATLDGVLVGAAQGEGPPRISASRTARERRLALELDVP